MKVVELEINKGEYLTDVFKRENEKEKDKYPFNAIPTNCIFDKTLPGLGATHSEIEAERHSIIIEPNIPVILGKAEKNKNILPVYEKITDSKVLKYFQGKVKYKKILCTPESFMKVRRIAEDNGVDIYGDYFCLFDECEKITQDIDYRENIALPMDYFFWFQQKAFVSATPLELRNPGFEANDFFKLKIKPLYEYRKPIQLIVTNYYDKTVIEKLDELKNSECVCVFLNSTNGLNKLINHLERQKIKDYKAFCSIKSVLKFEQREITNSFENLHLPLAKYNFFTSRFFSAVDFYVDKKPDILVLTDLNEAKYSRLDPRTNTIQIYGRFRNEFPDGEKFNSLTHISNVDETETVLPETDIKLYLDEAEQVYNSILARLSAEETSARRLLLESDLEKLTYNRFIDDSGTKNYFAIDNFYDDERIKSYYLSAKNLEAAYIETNHLIPKLSTRTEPISDKELLK